MADGPIDKVLVVDDSAMARKMMAKVLAGLLPGAEIIEAGEAESGFEKWQSNRPGLSILDLNMPGQNGLELAERILGEDENASIILCTANVQQATQDKAQSMGVKFVGKPVNSAKLKGVLEVETAL